MSGNKRSFLLRRLMVSLAWLWAAVLACSLPGMGDILQPPASSTAVTSPPPNPQATASLTFAPDPSETPSPLATASPSATPTLEIIRFAVIGDYGDASQAAHDVADLVKSWKPEFIITVGDNNYPIGAPDTIDDNVGQFYHEFIYPYLGKYGPGADRNRFFPVLGNHDWDYSWGQPYLDYFTLPGNERYYDFAWGPVHFFALSSDSREPDGFRANSVQAMWLQERMAASTSPWQLVYMHHSPYTSGIHGPVVWMDWPFQEWGADAVLAGHDHVYERLLANGLPYFINGLGSSIIYDFFIILPESQFRYNDDSGAMLVEATATLLRFQFINKQGVVVDVYEMGR